MQRKFSRQRESIKRNLLERRDHPTADMVFADIRKEYPNVSLGTVYRNLSLFADLGEIRKLPSANGADHFDGNMVPHHHFVCSVCGEIQDLFLSDAVSRDVEREAADKISGTITDCSMTFSGICDNCSHEHMS
ncbi:MAG: transcriptional repressor [Lachnospiraceae bacterium]|nr:transcriptional repressor [Lachnospiraceae bacterium]